MGFHRDHVVELVRQFYRQYEAEAGTEFVVATNLPDALRRAGLIGADGRWASIPLVATALDARTTAERRGPSRDLYDVVYRHVLGRPQAGLLRRFPDGAVVSAAHGNCLPATLQDACSRGLGWLLLAERTAIMVPTPVTRVAEGRHDVLHDDTGRMAVIWPDGYGYYFLYGAEFDKRLYFQVINHDLLIQDIAALDNADQRAIALQYLTFEQLVIDSDAHLIDNGERGTRLYRLELPPRMARDRKPGHGGFDYFIHMRDASHPEREFIEWIDPEIGQQRNAELCQAHAFGISLEDWLAIQQEG